MLKLSKTLREDGITEMLNRLKIGGLGRIRRMQWRFVDFVNPSHPFLTEGATRINVARQQHLDLFKNLIDENYS